MTTITNRQHPLVKRCRALAFEREGTEVLLDGEHLVAEAMAAGLTVEALLMDERPRALAGAADARGIARFEGTRAVLDAASPVRAPTGVVAIARWAPARLETLLGAPDPLLVGLVGVQDPGNVGAVIRTAHALGATGVVALGETADPGGWKALRGAMGSTFRVPVAVAGVAETLAASQARGIRVAATAASDGEPIDQTPLPAGLLILVGNEGSGLDADLRSRADLRLRIPMAPGVNSLNVSVSAALCLWEARRQRLPPGTGGR